ncbi:unnamed protein product [Cladocopium goreaui]|uniref:Type II methyltransferase M.NgoBI (M.NgoBI) (Cytosine-specific methyltransferase NgoBI) (M.NgoI) (Modification methylase NgoBI) n=1 Tax=Cladocopium goreaui TaxID=2562237 RepID=A0A9P1FT23_9DINO|nr:unnamed protein product [Cladocopium goreaui]CAI3991849.1 unnamed protein product [Cladocopium goreaui]
MPKRNLVLAEDCAGLGPLKESCKLAGLQSHVYYVSESDPKLLERLKKIYKPELVSKDAMKKKGIRQLIDIFGAGCPCQPFSPIGKRKGKKDPRAKVFERVVKRIQAWLPDTFVLENSKSLTNKKHAKFFKKLLAKLKSKGHYKVYWKVLDAFTHGALPQRRERLWIVGVNSYAMKGQFSWPKPLKNLKKIKLCKMLGRKAQDYEFPKSSTGKKRLRTALKWEPVLNKGKRRVFRKLLGYFAPPIHEKCRVQGWDPKRMQADDLSVREMGLALGNAWLPAGLAQSRMWRPQGSEGGATPH